MENMQLFLMILEYALLLIIMILLICIYNKINLIYLKYNSNNIETNISMLEREERLLPFIKHITTETAIMEFKLKMRSVKDMSKTNMAAVCTDMISDTATHVHNSLSNEITFDGLLAESFYDKYIIDIASTVIEELLSRAMENYE